jgi:hypothetical protein
LAVVLALHASPAASQADDAAVPAEEQVTITDLSRPGIPGKTFSATTVMRAPLQKLCAILSDFPRYPQFMPNTAKAEVVQVAPDHTLVDMTLSLPLGKIKRYRLRMEASGGAQLCRLAWKLVPRPELTPDDTIADTAGYWQLVPQPDSRSRTLVEYFVYADPGPVPFGLGWIVDLLSRESLPQTLEALRERAGAR